MQPPDQQAELGGLPPSWTKDNTRDYLSAFPLPADFMWPGKDGSLRAVCPSYSITDYGKWLRETPNYPGLFDACHEALIHFGEDLPASDRHFIAELERRRPAPAASSKPAKPEPFSY